MTERIRAQFAFLSEIDKMKSVLRRNILIDRTRQEDDAGHSWHMAMCAMLLSEYASEKVDLSRVIRMALVHDLVEVYAGDTFCYDVQGNLDKAARERAAADRLYALLPPDQGPELRALWEEFDRMDTPDSRFAAALDRLQPFLLNYHTGGHTWHLGHVTRAQLLARLDPIRVAAPALWDAVLSMLRECEERGWLTHEAAK